VRAGRPVTRSIRRAIPWRALLIVALVLGTVPAMTAGLAVEAWTLVFGAPPTPYPAVALALLLVASPLALLLLALAAMHIRSRARQARTMAEEGRRTRSRLASIIGAADDAIVLLDIAGRITAWNPAAERLYGLTAEAATGMPFDDLVDPRDRAAARDAFMVVVAGDRRATTEGRHRRGGQPFAAVAVWASIRQPDGTVDGVSVLVRDASATVAARARADESERRLQLLTDSAIDAVIGLDDAGTVVGWNPAAVRLFGLTADEAIGRSFADLVLRPAADAALPAAIGTAGPAAVDAAAWLTIAGSPASIVMGIRDDGSTFPAELSMATFRDDGRAWYTAFVRDVTERLRAEAERLEAERAKRETEARYRSLVENLPGVVYRCGVGRWAPTLYVSPHISTLLGYAPDEWVGIPGIWEEHIHPADLQRVLSEDEREAARTDLESPVDDREYRMRTRDGREIWVRDHADLERAPDGTPVAWNGFLVDITERKRLESELRHLAFHDALTGLANRALLNDRIGHALNRIRREAGVVAMLVLDVDDFKRVNDAHGHEAGDRLLVAVAERLKGCLRPDATLARLGGDEFAILLEGLSDDAGALVVAQRVVHAFDAPLRLEGMTLSARVSVGVAVDVTGQRTAGWLMRSADTAMYEAKRLGKGRWQAYDPAAHLASAKRLVLENELRRAVERSQFVLAYQPVTDLRTGEIVGTEALLRWNHPTRGVVLPGEFISILESTGLIEPVGRWVVDEACRQAALWTTQVPSLRWTAVNVSAAQLGSDRFQGAVQASIARHGLDPERLTLEVTESVALDESLGNIDRLAALRDLGIRIAIDDFGTGYSSLSYLRHLPIDRLKIDRAFVDGLGTDEEAMAVAKAIVELARSLRLTTVAEGIEQVHQADALRALGCELGQGFLYAKPLQPADLVALVAGRRAATRARLDAPEPLAS
jgi:diguanylate cyclase (GGDEF)-like protein/PAS domain S-box-containing protein